jgi:hypothetical protein
MKVFVPTSQLGEVKPKILGVYPDNSSIADDAHGEGVTVLTVPGSAIVYDMPFGIPGKPLGPEGFRQKIKGNRPMLAADWRQKAGAMPVEAEAKRRIAEAFPLDEQILSLLNIIDTIVTNGTDVSKWPYAAQQLKNELDQKRRYISEVKARAQQNVQVLPSDPGNDHIWPPRLPKKI